MVTVLSVFGFTAFIRVVEENDINQAKIAILELENQKLKNQAEQERTEKKFVEVADAIIEFVKKEKGIIK